MRVLPLTEPLGVPLHLLQQYLHPLIEFLLLVLVGEIRDLEDLLTGEFLGDVDDAVDLRPALLFQLEYGWVELLETTL